jgi:hypothetical protein
MKLSLIAMSGSGKSYWSAKLAKHGFQNFDCARGNLGRDSKRSARPAVKNSYRYDRQRHLHRRKMFRSATISIYLTPIPDFGMLREHCGSSRLRQALNHKG